MRRKIIVVLLAATLAAAMVIGLSGAYFTSNAEGPAVQATTGNVKLYVEGSGFNLSNLEPGGDWVTAGYFYVRNDGQYNVKWRMGLDEISDPGGLAPFIEVKSVMNPSDKLLGTYGSSYPWNYDIYAAIPGMGYPKLNQLACWGPFATVGVTSNPMVPGDWAWWRIDVRLSASANNNQANRAYSAKMLFNATQAINGGWAE